jgi:hypothetical protein
MQVSLLDEANQEVRELESEQRAAQARLTRLKNQVKDLEKGVGDGGGHGGDGHVGGGAAGGGATRRTRGASTRYCGLCPPWSPSSSATSSALCAQ